MKDTLLFGSEKHYRENLCDVDFWWPYILKALDEHKLPGADKRLIVKAGFNPTYPVFLIDDIVIKFFGHCPNWLTAFNTENAANEYLIKDESILAPKLLAIGELFPKRSFSRRNKI